MDGLLNDMLEVHVIEKPPRGMNRWFSSFSWKGNHMVLRRKSEGGKEWPDCWLLPACCLLRPLSQWQVPIAPSWNSLQWTDFHHGQAVGLMDIINFGNRLLRGVDSVSHEDQNSLFPVEEREREHCNL